MSYISHNTIFLHRLTDRTGLQPGAGAAMARMAMFEAGFPETVPTFAVNRQCASGLQAIFSVASQIQAGIYDAGIACGVESMTHNSFESATPVVNWDVVKACPGAAACMLPMGITRYRYYWHFLLPVVEVHIYVHKVGDRMVDL